MWLSLRTILSTKQFSQIHLFVLASFAFKTIVLSFDDTTQEQKILIKVNPMADHIHIRLHFFLTLYVTKFYFDNFWPLKLTISKTIILFSFNKIFNQAKSFFFHL